ncbi:MAG: hypothetical protein JSS79_07820 [Bacteroidetes bacterium]|nr:hypothetical protein [Bacteroidota bacterium]
MNYKMSAYVVSSSAKNESAPSDKRLLFSTRTGKGLIVSNFLIQKITNKDFSEIPMNVFLKLSSYEIIVHDDEDEFDIVLGRKKALYKDQADLNLSVNMNQIKPYDVQGEFDELLRAESYKSAHVNFDCNESSPRIIDLDLIQKILKESASIKKMKCSFSLECSIQYLSDITQWATENIVKLRINAKSNNLDKVRESIDDLNSFLSLGKHVLLNIILDELQSENVFDFLTDLSKKNKAKYSITFSSGKKLNKSVYANLELQLLLHLKKLGFDNTSIPNLLPGIQGTSNIGCGIATGYPIKSLFMYEFSDESQLYKLNVPCASCSVFPLCGVRTELWAAFGDSLCPSFRHNLGDRVALAYNKN